MIDDQVARDGKQPGVEPRLPVELCAAHQDPHPDLLEQILCHLAIARQIKEIAQQAVLIADNQLVKQASVLTLEPLRNGQALLPNLVVNCGGGTLNKEGVNRRGGAHRIN